MRPLSACEQHLLEEKNLSACAKILNLPLEANAADPAVLEKTILIEILKQGLSPIEDREMRMKFLSEYAEFFIKYIDKDDKNPIILDGFISLQTFLAREISSKESRDKAPIPAIAQALKKVAPILDSLAKQMKNRFAQYSLASAYWNYPLVFISELFSEKNLYDACIELFTQASKQGDLKGPNAALVQVYFSNRFLELNPDISESKRNELAMPFLESAAILGDGPANYWLAMILFKTPSLTNEQRIALSLPHFHKAAEMGIQHAKEFVEAIKNFTESKKRNEEAFNNDDDQRAAELLSSLNQIKGGNMRAQPASLANSDKSKSDTTPKPTQPSLTNSVQIRETAIPQSSSLIDVLARDASISDLIQADSGPKATQNMTEIAKQALRDAFRSYEAQFTRSIVKEYEYFKVEHGILMRNLEISPPNNLDDSEIVPFNEAVVELLLSKVDPLTSKKVLQSHILKKLPSNREQSVLDLGQVRVSSKSRPYVTAKVDLNNARIKMGSVVVVLSSAFKVYSLLNKDLGLAPKVPVPPKAPLSAFSPTPARAVETPALQAPTPLEAPLKVFSPPLTRAGESPAPHRVTIRVINPPAAESKKREAQDEPATVIESDPVKKSKTQDVAPEKSPLLAPVGKYSMFGEKSKVQQQLKEKIAAEEAAKLAKQQAQEAEIKGKQLQEQLEAARAKAEKIRTQKEEKYSSTLGKEAETQKRLREENEKLLEENLKRNKAAEEELARLQREIEALEESSVGTDEGEAFQLRK